MLWKLWLDPGAPDLMGWGAAHQEMVSPLSQPACPTAWHNFRVKRREKHLGICSQAMLLTVGTITHP